MLYKPKIEEKVRHVQIEMYKALVIITQNIIIEQNKNIISLVIYTNTLVYGLQTSMR